MVFCGSWAGFAIKSTIAAKRAHTGTKQRFAHATHPLSDIFLVEVGGIEPPSKIPTHSKHSYAISHSSFYLKEARLERARYSQGVPVRYCIHHSVLGQPRTVTGSIHSHSLYRPSEVCYGRFAFAQAARINQRILARRACEDRAAMQYLRAISCGCRRCW